jgi:hypothetical protein
VPFAFARARCTSEGGARSKLGEAKALKIAASRG